MNYIKIWIINTENSPLLHFTITYALKVIYIYFTLFFFIFSILPL